jgi:hypothetical protein
MQSMIKEMLPMTGKMQSMTIKEMQSMTKTNRQIKGVINPPTDIKPGPGVATPREIIYFYFTVRS